MMKKLLYISLIIPMLLIGQTATTINVSAEVMSSLSITNVSAVDFGSIQSTSAPVMDPKNVSHSDVGTVYSVGELLLSGTASSQVSVVYDASVTLGDGVGATMTFTPAVEGHASTQGSATPISSGSQVTMGAGGEYKIYVGGNLGTLTSQAVGTYASDASNGSGDMSISFEYY